MGTHSQIERPVMGYRMGGWGTHNDTHDMLSLPFTDLLSVKTRSHVLIEPMGTHKEGAATIADV